LKILILSFYFEPDLSAGSFRTTALVKAMLDQLSSDDKVDVVTTLPNRYGSYRSEALELEVLQTLTIRRIALTHHKSGMLDQSKAFFKYAKGVFDFTKGKNYDLVFATSSRLMTAVLAVIVSRRLNINLYVDIRDIFVDTIKDVLPKKASFILKPVLSILENWVIREAIKVNLVSGGFLPYFRERYNGKNLEQFTNGIDIEFIKAQPAKPVICYSSTLKVVYAGNMGEGQGLHLIIPGLAKIFSGRLTFKLIGDGGRKQQLVDALAAAGATNVEIFSPVKRSELIRIYQSADILFLHLNDYDAFRKVLPSKIFEYGALGKPIWAGVAGYAAEFIKENLINAAVFMPCNLDDAVKSFDCLDMITHPRKDFVEKFARVNIMKKMASDILSVAIDDANSCG